MSGGSGVFAGSIQDEAGFSATRRLSRQWGASAHVGFARNRNVVNVPGVNNPSYDDWYAGIGLNRPIGRDLNVALAYSATIQNHYPGCSSTGGPGCGTSATTSGQFITLSFRWHPRPFALQ
jgi:hypothetical protein